MAIEIQKSNKKSSFWGIFLIFLFLIAVVIIVLMRFFNLEDFITPLKEEEVLPTDISTKLYITTLNIDPIIQNPVFKSLVSHARWPMPLAPKGKVNIFRP